MPIFATVIENIMKSTYFSLFIFAVIVNGPLHAQDTPESSQDSLPYTLNGHFDDLLKKSFNYKDNGKRYEVVSEDRLVAFKNEVFDSLRYLQSERRVMELKLNDTQSSLEQAKAESLSLQTEIDLLEKQREQMHFLGIEITKTGYRALSGTIIICLLGGLVFFVYKYRHSNYVTQQARSAIEEMEHEFEQHRRWALEREQKLSRELLDERNKKRQTT